MVIADYLNYVSPNDSATLSRDAEFMVIKAEPLH